MFQLREQEIEHSADHGAGAACLIEHRLEWKGFDLLPTRKSLASRSYASGSSPCLRAKMMKASASSEANNVRLKIAVCIGIALSQSRLHAHTHRHHIRSPMMASTPMPCPTETANLTRLHRGR